MRSPPDAMRGPLRTDPTQEKSPGGLSVSACNDSANSTHVMHVIKGRPPRYKRCRALPTDPERRDRHQRERIRRAAASALACGELTKHLYFVLMFLTSLTTDEAQPNWSGQAYIGRRAGGFAARTVCRWFKDLKDLGWVHVQHRWQVRDGLIVGATNLWRIDIPEDYRVELEAAEDAKRAATLAKRRPERALPASPTPPEIPAKELYARQEAQRQAWDAQAGPKADAEVARSALSRAREALLRGGRPPP